MIMTKHDKSRTKENKKKSISGSKQAKQTRSPQIPQILTDNKTYEHFYSNQFNNLMK